MIPYLCFFGQNVLIAMSIFTNLFIYLLCHPCQGEGTLLAMGSYDGQARIWSRDGKQSISMCICVCVCVCVRERERERERENCKFWDIHLGRNSLRFELIADNRTRIDTFCFISCKPISFLFYANSDLPSYFSFLLAASTITPALSISFYMLCVRVCVSVCVCVCVCVYPLP
jgi:hypothetical protein